MTFIPTQSGLMRVKYFQKVPPAIFPNYPSLQPCCSAPRLEPSDEGADRRN